MHELQLLQRTLSRSCPNIHAKRFSSLMDSVDGLLACNKLALVNIGRNIPGSAQVKNKIKQCDCLLGNKYLYEEKISIYQSLTHLLISPYSRPIVLIDWSVRQGQAWLLAVLLSGTISQCYFYWHR